VIKHWPDDMFVANEVAATVDAAEPNAGRQSNVLHARKWPFDAKEKLLVGLIKVFSLSMPLYVTYKHLLVNHGRYGRIRECSCSMMPSDSVAMLQTYCHLNNQSTHGSNSRHANHVKKN
jgi:hypothetical protein